MLFKIVKFTLTLFLLLAVAYVLHRFVFLDFFSAQPIDIINFNYKFNLAITYILMLNVIFFQKPLKNQLGFIFLIGSALKFGLYLWFAKRLSIELNRSLFLHFFVPYIVCLGVEIYYITRFLSSANFKKNN